MCYAILNNIIDTEKYIHALTTFFLSTMREKTIIMVTITATKTMEITDDAIIAIGRLTLTACKAR